MPLITRVASNYTIVRDDDYVGVMGRGVPVTLTLPSIRELPQNHTITIKDEGGLAASLPITLTGALGDEEIENSSTYIINVNFGSTTLLFNGIQWVISASTIPQILSITQGGTGANNAPDAAENLGVETKDPVTVSAKTNINLAALPDVVSGGGGGPTIGNGLIESMGTLSVDIGPELQFVGNTIYAKAIGANRLQEYIVNQTGSSLPAGTAVAMRPNADGTQGVVRADSMTNIVATHVVAGIDIADGNPGYITKAVIFGSLDTSSAAGDGSPIYLDMNGGFIYDNPPSGSNTLAQVIGYVGIKNATTGTILFAPQIPTRYGTAFLQNGAVTAGKISASFSLTYEEDIISSPNHRLYIGGGAGSDPVVGATLVQATTGATATVTFLNDNDSLDVDSITGTFNTSDVVTGTNPDTSTFTFTPTMTVIDCWPLSNTAAAFSSITANDGTILPLRSGSMLLAANKVRFTPSIGITQGQIETLQSDGWTSLNVEYARSEVVVA